MLKQNPPISTLIAIDPAGEALIRPELLRHQDKDVTLLVINCLTQITFITAPHEPYSFLSATSPLD